MPRPPCIWLRSEAGFDPAKRGQLLGALENSIGHAKIITQTTDYTPDALLLANWLDENRPDIILSLGSMPQRMLTDFAIMRRIPVVVADLDADDWPRPGFWQRFTQKRHLARITRILVPDKPARDAAIRYGADPKLVSISGPLTETRPPLSYPEAELDLQAQALGGRQCWYAVAVPRAEEKAVLAAQHSALGHSHRTLLMLQPSDPARAPHLAARAEAEGLNAVIRSEVDEPEQDDQILILDDPGEAGLWYRLAPIAYIGGTLSGDDDYARHPFEAAGLGAAILHGPVIRKHQAAWRQLQNANATRMAPRQSALPAHLAALLEPETAAGLATKAWDVCTSGSGVASEIAGVIAKLLDAKLNRV